MPVSTQLCVFCGSPNTAPVYTFHEKGLRLPDRPYTISESEVEKPERVVRCTACELVRAEPFPDKDRLRTDYQKMDDPTYLEEESGRREQARVVLQRIRTFKKRGHLLDIGCGPGFLLDEARQMGWDVQGVELSEWGRRYGRERLNLDILPGPFTDVNLVSNHFDVIVLLDVIEHLEDPAAALLRIEQLLKPGGILYISTPDIDSALSRILKGRWWGIQKYHLYYFSQKTLNKALEQSGLRVIKELRYPRIFSWKYWAGRLEAYPVWIAGPFTWIARRKILAEKNLKITLHDQADVIARKPTTIENVIARETGPPSPPFKKQKVTVVLPAYNAARTLKRTVADIPAGAADEIILVDDVSRDRTAEIARELGLHVVCHEKNRGYGGNQKTCYQTALDRGADIVVMVHPDYQYDPKIIPELIEPILRGRADAVFGSRMMKGGALEGGMPLWKHNANILLTAVENVILGTYLTEYHSGFRAYSAHLLQKIPFEKNSDNFVFDTEIIVQLLANHFRIEEVPIQTRYFEEASSIRFWRSVQYGLSILGVLARYMLHSGNILRSSQFMPRKGAFAKSQR